MAAELKGQRGRTTGALADTRAKLEDIRRQIPLVSWLENDIAQLEALLAYLDAVLTAPAPAVSCLGKDEARGGVVLWCLK